MRARWGDRCRARGPRGAAPAAGRRSFDGRSRRDARRWERDPGAAPDRALLSNPNHNPNHSRAALFDAAPSARALLTPHPGLPDPARRAVAAFLGGGSFFVPGRGGGGGAVDAVRAALRAPPPRRRGRPPPPDALPAIDVGFAALRYLTGVAAVARRHGLAGAPADGAPPPPSTARLARTPARGALLVAHPLLTGPFARTVVLLTEAPPATAPRGPGPAGVVLGEPLPGERAASLAAAAAGGAATFDVALRRLAGQGARSGGGGATTTPPSPAPRVALRVTPLPAGDGADDAVMGYAVVLSMDDDETDGEEAWAAGGGGDEGEGDAPALRGPSASATALATHWARSEMPPRPAGRPPAVPPGALAALGDTPLRWGGPVPGLTCVAPPGEASGLAPAAPAAPRQGRRRRRAPPSPRRPPLAAAVGVAATPSDGAPLAAALAHAAGDASAARVYAGRAAWGRRQLSAEVRAGAWLVVAAPPPAAAAGADAWREVLESLGGAHAALAGVSREAAADAAAVAV